MNWIIPFVGPNVNRLTRFIIEDVLAEQTDLFGKARVRAVFNFSVFYFVMMLFAIPASLASTRPWLVFWLNMGICFLHVLPIFALKYRRSVKLATTLVCSGTYIAATAYSYVYQGELSVVIVFWYFLLIILAHFTLSLRRTLVFSGLILATISAIAILKIVQPSFFVVTANPEYVLIATPIVTACGLFILTIFIIEFERTRQQAEQQILESNRQKDHIIGTVAHDLKNPVGAVSSLLSFMRYELDEQANPSMAKRIRLTENAIASAIDIIDDLVESTRLEQPEASPLLTETVHLNTFVESSIELYRSRALEKAIGITLSAPTPSIAVAINKVKFSRVLDNLLSNAIKFTHSEGQVRVSIGVRDRWAVLSVADDGIGICPELHEKIFERFSDAGRPGTHHERTTGLGLSITKRIVELHGGTIHVESSEGQGATFVIELPLSADRIQQAVGQ